MNTLLADIGNTHFHIYDGSRVKHLTHEDAIKKYADSALQYISVNSDIEEKIGHIQKWKNISAMISLPNAYETMGVDRKALCLSRENGMFIDAGSAITVDVMYEGVYQGGYILPGLQVQLESYRRISPALDVVLDRSVDISRLPLTTKEQISYGIIASIKALVEKHRGDEPLYFTGGDGAFLSTFFDDAHYDETLVFEGMKQCLNR
jgi:type III pantothenate kinase